MTVWADRTAWSMAADSRWSDTLVETATAVATTRMADTPSTPARRPGRARGGIVNRGTGGRGPLGRRSVSWTLGGAPTHDHGTFEGDGVAHRSRPGSGPRTFRDDPGRHR